MREYFYEAPESLDELLGLLQGLNDEEVKLLAGGTDFVPKLSKELDEIPKEQKPPLHIIYMGNTGNNEIKEDSDNVYIGALVTLTEIEESNLIKQHLPVLIQAMEETAGHTVRNVATIGGNIMNASPAADSITPLLVLDAQFVLAGIDGSRTIAAKDFFTGPGSTVIDDKEVLTTIIIKKGKGKAAFKKLGRRKAETLSVVNAAAYIEMDNGICKAARLALGAVAPTAVRCYQTESKLVGKPVKPELIKEICSGVVEEINPIDDIRATAWYRKQVAPVMLERAINQACSEE